MKKYLVVSFLAVFMFSLSLFTNDSNEVQAASLGQKLSQPEEGWQRYDDTNPLINYSGDNWTVEPHFVHFNKTMHWVNDATAINSKIKFKFKGTKVRIITDRNINASQGSSQIISIDGKEENYSIYGDPQGQILSYEKNGLDNKVHTVEISTTGKKISLDAIDIDSDGYLIPLDIESPILEGVVTDEGHELTWNSIEGAKGFNVKRSLSAGGPYDVIASNVTTNSYLDKDIEKGKKYHYVVTAVVNGAESEYSNEVVLPINNSNATLILHLVNNQIKEYNLTSSELNNFINWFSSGSESYYVFTIKSPEPPYNSIKDYIIKDKIVWFQVKEY